MSETTDISVLKADRDILAQHFRKPGSVKLEKRLVRIVELIDRCKALIPEVGPTRLKMVGALVKREGLTERQAERIFTLTSFVHSKLPKGNRDFHVDFILGKIQDQLELTAGKPALQHKFLKLYADVLDKFFDAETPDLEEIRAKPIIVKYQPEILGIKQEENWRERAEKLREEMTKAAERYGG